VWVHLSSVVVHRAQGGRRQRRQREAQRELGADGRAHRHPGGQPQREPHRLQRALPQQPAVERGLQRQRAQLHHPRRGLNPRRRPAPAVDRISGEELGAEAVLAGRGLARARAAY
jgi:hypothetical protein